MKAVIFDLDGVVVYTDAYHYKAWKKLADDEGWAFDESLNDQLRGISRMASLQVILDHNGIDLPEEKKVALATRKNEDYKAFLSEIDESALVDGAIPFIKALRDRGVKTGLGSSSRNAMMVLESLGITDLFDAIVTGADISRSKPDPEIFLKGTERLGVDPAETVVFEDASSGVDAAQAGGMVAVGFGPSEGLDHAEIRVLSYDEIDIDTFVATGRPK
ncbi:MAG: beta-phosphoglucomutase [Alkalispirochaeta sp.]